MTTPDAPDDAPTPPPRRAARDAEIDHHHHHHHLTNDERGGSRFTSVAKQTKIVATPESTTPKTSAHAL